MRHRIPRHPLVAVLLLLVVTASCNGSNSTTEELRPEIEAAVAQIKSTLELVNPTVNIWGEACSSRDNRLSYCDELSASIQWIPNASQSTDLCQAALTVSAELESRLADFRVTASDTCGTEFCLGHLPGGVSMYEPDPTLQVMLGSDKSRCM